MKTPLIAASLTGLAAILATGLSSSTAPSAAQFDPLFDTGARCSGRQAGRPALLEGMILAQASQAETKPFQPGQQLPEKAAAGMPPLYPDLGKLSVPITTASARAQAYFNQGMRLTFGFNHAEAARAFKAAQALDPNCAMCYWGEALVLGPNINAPMFPEAAAPAAAAARAAQLSANARPVEQALIKALTLRYAASPPLDRMPLDQAYATGMSEAARAFPNDDTVHVLYAESLMNLAPWNYWDAGGTKPRAGTADMVAALERVLKRNTTHPGAIHYYIHVMEASNYPEKALPYARRLAKQSPGAGHIVHMPSHIYYRLGLYQDALQSNLDAIAADEKYFARSDSDPLYKGAYYPHNIHFVMVSALMGGDGKTALESAGKLDKSISASMAQQFSSLQPVKAAPYFSHVQFSSPDTVLALPDPGPDLLLVKAMWHYARAVAFARKGAMAEGRGEIDAIASIERTGNFDPIIAWGVPAREIVQTARAVANGRLADAQGDLPAAITFYQEAVAVQDKLPYTEPPYWYYPVRQSLGAALLRAGRLDEAEDMLRASLARTPSNGWALSALIELYRQRGDQAALAGARKRFATTWLGKSGAPALAAL
jgi:tetratricopeptide (TPR) repeat protein